MARNYAAVSRGIWIDDDFIQLTPAAQHLYFVLLTDPKLSYCGVSDWYPKRIATRAKNWTPDTIYQAALELDEKRLVIFDEDTEEYLIKSFVRYDGVLRHNRLCVSMASAYADIASRELRGVIVHQLMRIHSEEPDLPAWSKPKVLDVLRRPVIDPNNAPRLGMRLAISLGQELDIGLAQSLGQTSQSVWEPPTPAPAPAPLHQHHLSRDISITSDEDDQSQSKDLTRPAASRFDEFWSVYPRKVGKQKARTKYASATRRASEETIINGARRLATDPNLPEQQFIPHPTTWLERNGWEDEPLPPRHTTTPTGKARDFIEAGERLQAQIESAQHLQLGGG